VSVPSVWAFVLLALASYRLWRLLAEDDLLDRPRRWALRLGDWEDGQPVPDGYRIKWGEFLACPWCAGFWIAVGWWAAWLAWDDTLALAVPFALSAILGLVNAAVGWLTE
jgi:hypothetical protein